MHSLHNEVLATSLTNGRTRHHQARRDSHAAAVFEPRPHPLRDRIRAWFEQRQRTTTTAHRPARDPRPGVIAG